MLLGFVASLPSVYDEKYKELRRRPFISASTIILLLRSTISDFKLKSNITKDARAMPNTSKPRSKTRASPKSASSHSHSISHALQNVRRLPRKASRLVCITDPSDRGRQTSVKQDSGVGVGHGVEDEDAVAEGVGLIRCSESGLGSSSENGSATSGGYSASVSTQITDSASSISSPSGRPVNPIWTPGPILSPDELARALARHSLASNSNTVDPNPGSESRTNTQTNPDTRDVPRYIKGERTLANLIAASAAEDPIPRPLSPPPDHFRRRTSRSPYTSPVHSPPSSPQHHSSTRVRVHSRTHRTDRESACEGEGRDGQAQAQEQGARPVRLHDLLSSESLVASPLKLYNSADESSSDSESILALTLDRNLRVPGPPPRPVPRLRRTERASIFSQPRLRSRSRTRETSTRSPGSENERDADIRTGASFRAERSRMSRRTTGV